MADDQGRELGWNDTIENDGNDYVVLTPGEYEFQVKSKTNKRHPGADWLSACNTVELEIDIFDEDGKTLAVVKHTLYMHSKREWLLCQFFRSLGMRKHGEKFTPDWTKIVGKIGRCTIKNTTKANRRDPSKEDTFNNIDKFLDPPEASPTPPAPNGFTKGTF